jgi:predicted permease
MWGVRSLEILSQDLRYGARMIIKKPGFTLVAVMTLALGISANTTVFTYVNAVLFRLLTFVEPERVAFIWVTTIAQANDQGPVSWPEFKEWREQSRSFEAMIGVNRTARTLTGGDEVERISSAAVGSNYFQMLGCEPFRGRWFLPGEDQPGAARTAILSYNFWQRRFGGDQNALQQTILLDGERYTIIGIAPRDESQLLIKADVWEPLTLNPNQTDLSLRNLMVVGRIKHGVSVAQANAEMESIASRIAQQYPETNAGRSARVRTAQDQYLGAEGMTAIAMMVAAVFCVLMIACFNVAGMQLSRAMARRKEIAVRLALGASKWRLIRQLLTENLLIAVLGGVAGLLLASWWINVLHTRYAATSPFLDKAKIDWRVWAVTIALSLLSSILCGLTPMWQAVKQKLNDVLKEGGRDSGANAGNRMRNVLVTSEISLSLLLLIVAGLMMRSIIAIQTVNLGFDPDKLLMARITLPQRDYPSDQRLRDFFSQLMNRAVTDPGIKAAGAIDSLPLIGGASSTSSISIEGRPPAANNQLPWARVLVATPDYFNAIGIPLRLGRHMSPQDVDNSQPVALINQAMAQRYFSAENPIGKRVKIEGAPNAPWLDIVGVVENVRDDYVDEPPPPQVYLPFAQRPVREMSLVIRTTGAPLSALPALRNTVRTLDPNLPIYEADSMRQRLFKDLSTTHLVVELLGAFAVLATLLSAVGIYGIVAHSVSQRMREICVRMALGAQKGDILKLILWQGMKLTAIGLVIGLAAAFGVMRLMKSLLFGVSANDPTTFALTAVLLIVVVLLACWIPTRRATKADPMVTLRYE